MAINNTLIAHIADRLAMDESVVKNHLDEIIEDIHKRVSNNEEVEFGRLGSFYRKEGGALGFKPSLETLTDINFRYYKVDQIRTTSDNQREDEISVESPVLVIEADQKEDPEVSKAIVELIKHDEDQNEYVIKTIPEINKNESREKHHLKQSVLFNTKVGYRRKKIMFLLLTFLMCLFTILGLIQEGYLYHSQGLELANRILYNSGKDSALITKEFLTLQNQNTPVIDNVDTNALTIPEYGNNSMNPLFGFRGVYDSTLTGYYTIISKSYFDEIAADQGYQTAILNGYRARNVEILVTNRALWQLRIGQFQDRVQANAAVDSLQEAFRSFNIIKVD